jgi:hypothetical protein
MMMELNEFIRRYRKLIKARLDQKSGWGKKQAFQLIERTITDVLIGEDEGSIFEKDQGEKSDLA